MKNMEKLDGEFASAGGDDDDDNDEEDNEDDKDDALNVKDTEPNIHGIPVQFPCLSRIPLDSKDPEEFSGAERVSPGETGVGDRGEESEAVLATGGGDEASVPSSTADAHRNKKQRGGGGADENCGILRAQHVGASAFQFCRPPRHPRCSPRPIPTAMNIITISQTSMRRLNCRCNFPTTTATSLAGPSLPPPSSYREE